MWWEAEAQMKGPVSQKFQYNPTIYGGPWTRDYCKVMTQQQQMIWLDLSEAEKFGSNSYSTTIFQHKYINSGQYGGISLSSVTTQVCRGRLKIMPKMIRTMTYFNISRIKMTIHRKCQGWHPLRGLNIYSTRNNGCPTSYGSTSAQTGSLTSVVLETSSPRDLENLWTLSPPLLNILWTNVDSKSR